MLYRYAVFGYLGMYNIIVKSINMKDYVTYVIVLILWFLYKLCGVT